MTASVSQKVIVPNPQGIHARPSAMIVKCAQRFSAAMRIANDREAVDANARSILEVMTLVATQGTELRISADGEDAEAAVTALVALVRRGFDEMDT